ncbi:exocyst complex component exo70 [Balamuthia mandrillaris]
MAATKALESAPPAPPLPEDGSWLHSEELLFMRHLSDASRQRRNKQLERIQSQRQRIEELQGSLQKSSTLADRMDTILSSFEGRLSTLEHNIKPLHSLTANWKTVHSNVDSASAAIQQILDVFNTANKVEQRIKLGFPSGTLSPVPMLDSFDTFLACLETLNESIEFLRLHSQFKSAQSALSNLETLRRYAVSECERALRLLLTDSSAPIDVPTVLSPEVLTAVEAGRQKIEVMPKERFLAIDKLMKQLQRLKQFSHLKTFTEKRALFLRLTLRKLSPDRIAIDESTPVQSALESAQKTAVSVPSSSSSYKRGTHKYIRFMRVVLVLIKHERWLIHELVPKEHFGPVFGPAVDGTLDLLIETGQSVMKHHLAADKVFGCFVVMDILEHLQNYKQQFHKAIMGESGKEYEDLNEFVSTMSSVLRRTLGQLIPELSALAPPKLPPDGAVHDLTILTFKFLFRLVEYKSIACPLLPTGSSDKSSPEDALKAYVEEVLKEVYNTLRTRSEMTKKKGRVNIFLLNNIYFMKKALDNPALKDFVRHGLVSRLEEHLARELSTFKDNWNKAKMPLVADHEEPFAASSVGELSNRQKKKIKSRFATFNAEFDGLVANQKQYSMADKELAQQLKEDIKQSILPLYKAFIQRYDKSGFSKNPGKYVRYHLQTVSDMIETSFREKGTLAASASSSGPSTSATASSSS